MHNFPDELLNNSRLRVFRKQEIKKKSSKLGGDTATGNTAETHAKPGIKCFCFCLILLLFDEYFVTDYSIIDLVNTNVIITKVTDIENKKPDIINLGIQAAVNTNTAAIENKIPETSILVKETDYDTKITKGEHKIPDVSDFGTKPRYINNIVTKQVQGKKKLCDQITFLLKTNK